MSDVLNEAAGQIFVFGAEVDDTSQPVLVFLTQRFKAAGKRKGSNSSNEGRIKHRPHQ